MINTLMGVKKDMTSTYDSRGRRVGATVVEVSPNFVMQIKTLEGKDGYNAVQLGFGTKKSVKKSQLGIGKKLSIEKPVRWFEKKFRACKITSIVADLSRARCFGEGMYKIRDLA